MSAPPLPSLPTDPRDPSWGRPPLPSWVENFRPWQLPVIEEAAEAIESGKRFIFLEAPTGSGKTLLAEAIRRRTGGHRAAYLCNTKTLQQQFLRDYPYTALLMGRSNYPTLDHPDLFTHTDPTSRLTAADCAKELVQEGETGPWCDRCPVNDQLDGHGGEHDDFDTAPTHHCETCHPWYDCPYELAKSNFLSARLGTTNTAYFLTECNGPGRIVNKRWDRITQRDTIRPLPFVIIDEADEMENSLMSYISLSISPRRRAQLNLPFPEKKTKSETWGPWAEEALKILSTYRSPYSGIRRRRDERSVELLRSSLRRIKGSLESNWIYDDYRNDGITFRPVRVDGWTEDYLWRYGQQFLLMSATICSVDEMCESLGIPHDDTYLINVPSPFPVENRQVYVVPRANMTFKTKEAEWPKMAETVVELCNTYRDDKILVHTVSYAFTQFLTDHFRRQQPLGLPSPRVYTYTSAAEREAALTAFRASTRGILLAPSMERGVDLPDEDCRCIVVCKVPYPNRGDKQINARMYTKGGQEWYALKTVRALVQMTGRGVRSVDDWCDTFILDAQFPRFYRRWKHIFPAWWKDGLNWRRGGPNALAKKGDRK